MLNVPAELDTNTQENLRVTAHTALLASDTIPATPGPKSFALGTACSLAQTSGRRRKPTQPEKKTAKPVTVGNALTIGLLCMEGDEAAWLRQ